MFSFWLLRYAVTGGQIDKLVRRDSQLSDLIDYIRSIQPAKLQGYAGHDIDLILRLLRENRFAKNQTTDSTLETTESIDRHADASDAGVKGTNRVHSDESEFGVKHMEHGNSQHYNIVDWRLAEHGEHDLMHEVAHGLHFASIAMLGFLVVEVSSVSVYVYDGSEYSSIVALNRSGMHQC